MVTLITPTADREDHLRFIYYLLQQQTYSDWQWWICDTSYKPSPFFSELANRRVHYLHSEKSLTVGEKRNLLIEESQGEVIAHIDDDDYYHASYLEQMVGLLEGCDFVSLTAWFLYDIKAGQGYYWCSNERSQASHYIVEPLSGTRIKEIALTALVKPTIRADIQKMGVGGYGFSYIYRRAVWQAHPFKAIDFREDHFFFEEAEKKGFNHRGHEDYEGIVVKIIHDQNVSLVYAQYRIPPFLMERYLPHFTEMIDAYYPFDRS